MSPGPKGENVITNLAELGEGPHLDGDAWSAILADLADVPTDELVMQLRRRVHVLEAFTQAAEAMDLARYLILSDAEMEARGR